jgi:hypothetical protein
MTTVYPDRVIRQRRVSEADVRPPVWVTMEDHPLAGVGFSLVPKPRQDYDYGDVIVGGMVLGMTGAIVAAENRVYGPGAWSVLVTGPNFQWAESGFNDVKTRQAVAVANAAAASALARGHNS